MPLAVQLALAALLLAGAPPPATSPEAASPAPAAALVPGRLTIELNGLRPARGRARLAVFRSDEGFPMEFGKAFKLAEAPVAGAQVVLSLEGLEPGEYAIAVFHDENGNGELDTNFLGIPKEGLGVSNDAKGSFGPPKYRGAAFTFDGLPRRLSITMKYL